MNFLLASTLVYGTGGGLISLLISILILAIVCGVVYWIITLLPLPSPWKQIVLVCFLLIVLLVVLQRFLGVAL